MPVTSTPPKMPGDVDVEVGQRIKALRAQCGMTQQKLADLTGVTFQQVQKYENGKNRISAGRLKRISEVLGVDIGHLYGSEGRVAGAAPDTETIEAFLGDSSSWPLVEAWSSLPVAIRTRLGQLVFSMASMPDQQASLDLPVRPEPARRIARLARA